ncbi:MAG: cyclic nucleotide-binding domain-containing protein [Nitrospinae bacterium]|nr:cyclic nucleotide-binding domain-containing protein [Nitrospinota bacterium]
MPEWDREEVLQWIRTIPFFKEFTEDERRQIADLRTHLRTFHKNQTIVRQDDIDLSLFIILRGEVSLTKNERPHLKIIALKPGALFGEVSFVKPRSRLTNVIAETETIVLKMDGELFESLSQDIQGKIKDKVLQMLIRRLDEMNNALITYVR